MLQDLDNMIDKIGLKAAMDFDDKKSSRNYSRKHFKFK